MWEDGGRCLARQAGNRQATWRPADHRPRTALESCPHSLKGVLRSRPARPLPLGGEMATWPPRPAYTRACE